MNLAAVATAAGVAFVLGRLMSRAEVVAARREASTDALTGLTNRAGLMRQLRIRTTRRLPYAIALIDLNGFKPVNDTYGHRVGDALLVALARRLQAAFPDQVLARLGGDEFVLILDGLYPCEVVEVFVESVARVVRRPACVRGAGAPVVVTAAVGVSRSRPHEDPRVTLHAADQAMYRSKVTGRPCMQQGRPAVEVDEAPRARWRDKRYVRVA